MNNQNRPINVEDCRTKKEKIYGFIVTIVGLGVFLSVISLLSFLIYTQGVVWGVIIGSFVLLFLVGRWLWFKLFYYYILSHSVRLGDEQFHDFYNSILTLAKDILDIPESRLEKKKFQIYMVNGYGVLELFLHSILERRGILIFTRKLLSESFESGLNAAAMFCVAKQLGHIALKHDKLFWIREWLGAFSLIFHSGWNRWKQISAYRVAMYSVFRCPETGNIDSAKDGAIFAYNSALRALMIRLVGSEYSYRVNLDRFLEDQHKEFSKSFFAWLFYHLLSNTPTYSDIIKNLSEFHNILSLERHIDTKRDAIRDEVLLKFKDVAPISLMQSVIIADLKRDIGVLAQLTPGSADAMLKIRQSEHLHGQTAKITMSTVSELVANFNTHQSSIIRELEPILNEDDELLKT